MKSTNLIFIAVAVATSFCAGQPAEAPVAADSSAVPHSAPDEGADVVSAASRDTGETAALPAEPLVEIPEPSRPVKLDLFATSEERTYPWLEGEPGETIVDRFPPPKGFERVLSRTGSYANWLRHLPLKPGVPNVLLFDGSEKGYQGAQAAVLDVDVGSRDLQQCVDACMRLRAEYLFGARPQGKICFRAVSGKAMKWRGGRDYRAFRKYMNKVFGSANTRSVLKMAVKVEEVDTPMIGHIYLNRPDPNSFGHAVTVMDAAQAASGRMAVLLSQSYMPAQDVHILKNPSDPDLSPWYIVGKGDDLVTPEWRFAWADLYRFPDNGCVD